MYQVVWPWVVRNAFHCEVNFTIGKISRSATWKNNTKKMWLRLKCAKYMNRHLQKDPQKQIAILYHHGITFETCNNNDTTSLYCIHLYISRSIKTDRERAKKVNNKICVVQDAYHLNFEIAMLPYIFCGLYGVWHKINIQFTFHLVLHMYLQRPSLTVHSSYEPLNNLNVWTVNTEDECVYNGKMMGKIVHFGQIQYV